MGIVFAVGSSSRGGDNFAALAAIITRPAIRAVNRARKLETQMAIAAREQFPREIMRLTRTLFCWIIKPVYRYRAMRNLVSRKITARA